MPPVLPCIALCKTTAAWAGILGHAPDLASPAIPSAHGLLPARAHGGEHPHAQRLLPGSCGCLGASASTVARAAGTEQGVPRGIPIGEPSGSGPMPCDCGAYARLTLPSITETHELVVPRSIPMTSLARSTPPVLRQQAAASQHASTRRGEVRMQQSPRRLSCQRWYAGHAPNPCVIGMVTMHTDGVWQCISPEGPHIENALRGLA